ncbi:MAG: zinc ribbon domain-containing protein [Anaerolineae bacterium]
MQNQPPASTGKVYEMLWDCRFCGTKKLLGKTHRFCPNCGGQQDPSWRYFPSDAEKVAVQDHVYVGADKICKACKSLNSAIAEFCGNCGAPLSDAPQAALVGNREKAEGESFETENLKERQQATAAEFITPKPAPRKGMSIPMLVLLVAIPLIIGGAIFALTRTRSAAAYVTGHHWERTIQILSLQPVPSKGNCDLLPLGAYNVDQRYEQVGSHRVPDGQECRTKQIDQGDGTFREEEQCTTTYRDEPDYGYVCYYVVNTWLPSREARAEGDKSTSLVWPDTNIRNSGCLIIGCEQEGSRSEQYVLTFKGDGDRTFECPVSYDLWNESNIERGFNIEVGQILKDFRCNTLKPVS